MTYQEVVWNLAAIIPKSYKFFNQNYNKKTHYKIVWIKTTDRYAEYWVTILEKTGSGRYKDLGTLSDSVKLPRNQHDILFDKNQKHIIIEC